MFTILSVRGGLLKVKQEEDGTWVNTEDKVITFGVESAADLASLPACLPFSRAVDAQYMKDATDATAYIAIKKLDGSWL